MTDQELEVFVLNDEFDTGAGLNPDNFDEVVKNIRVLITKLKGSHMSEGNIREFELNFSTPQLSDGSRVDYQQMSKSDVFLEYCREVSKLKSLNAAALEQNKVFCKHYILYHHHLCIFSAQVFVHQHLQQSHHTCHGPPGQDQPGSAARFSNQGCIELNCICCFNNINKLIKLDQRFLENPCLQYWRIDIHIGSN